MKTAVATEPCTNHFIAASRARSVSESATSPYPHSASSSTDRNSTPRSSATDRTAADEAANAARAAMRGPAGVAISVRNDAANAIAPSTRQATTGSENTLPLPTTPPVVPLIASHPAASAPADRPAIEHVTEEER